VRIDDTKKEIMMKFETKEEAIANKKKGDRLFYDPFINEYFIISPKKYIWKEGEFEENFIMMPETIEECIALRSGHCQNCEYLPHRHGSYKFCRRRSLLSNRERMEIF